MIDIVTNIDNLIISIIQKYNGDNIDISDNSLRDNLKKIYNSELVSKLIEYIITLTINDLDVGKAYYNKTEGELTVKKLMINELKLRQANESRSNMKNQIDKTLLHMSGKSSSKTVNIRITNIDSFSAYIDRLITERIKEYHFKNKQNKLNEALHQVEIIKIILYKIVNLLEEINVQNGYAYIGEKRTFDEEKITNDVNKLLKELI
jgi:hypothetical protein